MVRRFFHEKSNMLSRIECRAHLFPEKRGAAAPVSGGLTRKRLFSAMARASSLNSVWPSPLKSCPLTKATGSRGIQL